MKLALYRFFLKNSFYRLQRYKIEVINAWFKDHLKNHTFINRIHFKILKIKTKMKNEK